MEQETWPNEWMRAILGLCVLKSLESGPTYGYAIATTLETAGFGTVKGGTLYPLLTRLENSGWLETEWRAGEAGPGRKYFSLTTSGQQELDRRTQQWERFAMHTVNHLTGTGSQLSGRA
ncbi:PadR family transcriptional regulator [Arthrobacter castelli]|uniref:PadR family transcriptional regulator n=1 Tax=Arthrobacter castelli TaxID=271431 RepID=UPI000415F829|nr:PadR family transcriptional regulator [Arthrobacter castelli]